MTQSQQILDLHLFGPYYHSQKIQDIEQIR